MVSSDANRVALRPARSPKWPNSTDPRGRATKATPKVASEASRAPLPPEEWKNSSGNTEMAAVA
ncbi:hypothetical protein [Propionibacterium freudenreichii]|uniref:hypothetical protein n=1 Tax=Propionibacterium freudenreichii TaxID=1744 RepID=UPI00254B8DF9|nr:hypothetical protein [Propionibacterium freudenreichii]